MPFTMNDYPDSLKHLEHLERKKAIDIINAMLEDGYEEDKAIPIAIKEAQNWYKDADNEDLKELKYKHIQNHGDENESRGSSLINNDIEVFFGDSEWKVQTQGTKKPSKTFRYKKDAVEYAKDIADNRGTKTIIHDRRDQ